jgi:hypothetical protein
VFCCGAAQALHPDCNLLPETIGKAALKAEDSLKVLQVRHAAEQQRGCSSCVVFGALQVSQQ